MDKLKKLFFIMVYSTPIAIGTFFVFLLIAILFGVVLDYTPNRDLIAKISLGVGFLFVGINVFTTMYAAMRRAIQWLKNKFFNDKKS